MSEWSYSREGQRTNKRGRVVFQAVVFSALFAIVAAGFAYLTYQMLVVSFGSIVGVLITLFLGSVLGLQAYQYVRDVNAEPVLTEGEIGKKWSKASFFFFFMPAFYIAVKGKIYSISKADYAGIIEGDLVRVLHYPHSLTVETLERYDDVAQKFVPAAEGGLP
jgi:hypothetical protein